MCTMSKETTFKVTRITVVLYVNNTPLIYLQKCVYKSLGGWFFTKVKLIMRKFFKKNEFKYYPIQTNLKQIS